MAVSLAMFTPDQRFLDTLPDTLGDAATLLPAIRQAGRDQFAASGLPTKRHEAWRFTDLKSLQSAEFASAGGDTAGLDQLLAAIPGESARVVFVDGRIDDKRSWVPVLPDDAHLGSFAAWARDNQKQAAGYFDLGGGIDRAFLSLNAALFTDGLMLSLPSGTVLEQPVHVVHWNSGGVSQLKHVFDLGDAASVTVIETYAGTGLGWTNLAVKAELGQDAVLGRYILQNEAIDAFHTASFAADIGRRAKLDAFVLNLGARSARHDATPVLGDERGFCGYSGAYFLDGRQDFTVASVIGHHAPHCGSREVFKGVLDDRAHGAFQGKIHVAIDAQKTDGYQLNKTMLLSDRAVMDSKPELEIYADDVKCSHGATIGDLDDNALFYLRSRGIDADTARQMLIHAFVADAIDLVENAEAREYLTAALAKRLSIKGEKAR